jgi:hypothetical protein
MRGERERKIPSDPATGARNDDNLAFYYLCHDVLFCSGKRWPGVPAALQICE